MSQEQLEAFMSKVHKDKSLQERLKNSTSNDEVRAIARELGHEISLDAKLKPLSDGELEEVAGGGWCGNACTNWNWSNGMGTGC
ncbi:Nif11-like leader peptide family natural product precursor [Synechococcus sp. BS56D]|uniref:Nif11-like leader peptide family natural product precursor n=1 Tax=Synechococcus sp. BS56D TaxID=2055944 RepID=UPI00103A3E01|nr:Nif11-like leader peptide family natural product precursor [Synechococcus sp. BS56D]TCD55376.1 Nif11-like leader peptide family natural product precursor [Synechococcus sp. BS56D]